MQSETSSGPMSEQRRSRRFVEREQRELRRELLITPFPELGLVAMNGPNDPEPGLEVRDGRVVSLDGRGEDEFDALDHFIARHGIDVDVAVEAMALADVDLACRLVDVDVSREELVRLARGLTPARLARVVALLDPVEMMFSLKKLRARRAPANQAHVTNLKENPALLAADAAEAAARGFAEIETTVGVSRYAPFNAMAVLGGSQTGRPGVLTQCAIEERRSLQLAIQGITTYAETRSVYGTEPVFVDGDDTPWSKGFLNSAYASRGIKVRFTSGGGSEALMGHAGGCSMLYLEARCLCLARAAGSQGVQNGSISCVALVMSLPAGSREILAENLLAAWLDLEVASGNDAIASHSPTRRTAKLMGQFLPGTDFVTSGWSIMPRYDNMFGGGNYDADDLDEWLTIQRDWQVDGGIEPLGEEEALRVRERAARAIQAVFAAFDFPEITDAEIDAQTLDAIHEGEPAIVVEKGAASKGSGADEVVIALGPAFADGLRATIAGLPHRDVLEALIEGVREAGARPRLVRVRRASDVAFIGHDGAVLAGSGVAIGIQSKGTTVIHRADLEPLDNLELFGMAPSLTLDSYRAIGRNAAGYALGHRVGPGPTVMGNFARAKLIVHTTLLHARETAEIARDATPVELELAER